MKLTEKELNEFPIGTKIYTGYGKKYMKLDNSPAEWREMKDNYWMSSGGLLNSSIKQVEIPTYTEYIPPKPILDDKEKKYLSGVIKPFKKNIYGAFKHECDGCYYITLFNSRGYNIDLPFFKKGTMYKGMELDREYSLEELRHIKKGGIGMLVGILFIMIGLKTNMGTSYYVLLGIIVVWNIIETMIKSYFKGRDSNNKF